MGCAVTKIVEPVVFKVPDACPVNEPELMTMSLSRNGESVRVYCPAPLPELETTIE